ncbi:hypothetical protein K443DRAFT_14375 [Laccaria amethystina LaAM-08-1]|uniref:Uncharacterized protein n=1 Tax=Laccaria amethystina LaAM-08-1 TaxID=1095629 RepID=A0A0C9WMW8_9AGAR|nr:hypothetical protein K443DRAFT_15273 [Laccaria amethystina LaAM-08-1]KIJ91460.1 hypothetical protein K443DRAFT_14375 [Laccaria amethystina LaAM-08-1]
MADKKLDPRAYPSAVEVEWTEALQHLEKRMVIYRHAKTGDNDQEIGGAAEDVALAMEDVAAKHPDAKVKKAYRTKAAKIRKSTGDNRDAVVEDIGKGLLVLLTTPFALAGAILGGVGQVLGGVGSMLRGWGKR